MIDDTLIKEVSIEKITNDDINIIRELHNIEFSYICDFDILFYEFDYSNSVKLVFNGRIIGFYLLRPLDIIDYFNTKGIEASEVNLSIFDGLRGICGCSLFIKNEYRDRGYGEMLKSSPITMGYDYVFGGQDKRLNNLKHWLKRRFLVHKHDCQYGEPPYYVTAEIFKW